MSPNPCTTHHRYEVVEPVWIDGVPGLEVYTAGSGFLYRCKTCGRETTHADFGGTPYRGEWVSLMEFSQRNIKPTQLPFTQP